jgi:hypothetical protein
MMSEIGVLRQGDILELIDLDEEMIVKCKRWAESACQDVKLIHTDYLDFRADVQYDYAILNPPYLRQEWLDKKNHYQEAFKQHYGLTIPGTSNLYVYFIAKVLMDLKQGGSFACVVYDSWQSTKYGRWLRHFIEQTCSQLEIVPLRDQPFEGRLIDATLIFGVKKCSTLDLNTELSVSAEGGSTNNGFFNDVDGFSPISKIYETKRGLRLKQADFFLCDLKSVSDVRATPFVKKIARVSGYLVPPEHPEAALLLTDSSDNPAILSELERRLSVAQSKPEDNESILTWHRERPESWMLHRIAPHAPVLFNYYIRKRPRHLYNPTRAYSDNFYGLTPPEGVPALATLAALNSTVVCCEILNRARNQGSGLAKIQLFEYRDVYVPDLRKYRAQDLDAMEALGRELVEVPGNSEDTIIRIDRLIADIHNDPKLESGELKDLFSRADRKARRPKEA